MPALYIYYRGHKASLNLPPGWKLLTFARYEQADAGRPMQYEPEQRVKAALDHPIGSAPLRRRLTPEDSVAILIEDQTRASPKKAVLRALLETLEKIGLPPDKIVIVIALGTHRFLSPPEIKAVYGSETAKRYRIVNHDCRAADLVPIGKLSSGSLVKINRLAHAATLKIGIGSIFAHPLNGFGGGGKILFPGIADFDSILEHHLKHSFRGEPVLGICEGNPFYDEVCHLAAAGGLDFIINSILDHQDRFQDVVCGHPVQAHLAGILRCRQLLSKSFRGQADITIISSFPYSEGPQIMKPLTPAAMVTRPGGSIVLAADLATALPETLVQACENFRKKHRSRLRQAVFEHFDRNQRIVEGPPELNMAMAQLLLTLDAYKVILVSPDVSPDAAQRLGFQAARDFRQAFAIAARFHTNPSVHVIPAGGLILPVLANE